MNNLNYEKLSISTVFSDGWVGLFELAQQEHKHFHPSSNLIPSKEDTMLTDRMLKVSELIGIPLLDHIIVGGDNSQYFSFKEKDLLTNTRINLQTNCKTLDFLQGLIVAEDKSIKKKPKKSKGVR